MKVRAYQFAKHGGPDVLEFKELTLGKPGRGEALVRHEAIGLNYIDTYQRSGLYPMRCRAASAWRRPAWSRRSAKA